MRSVSLVPVVLLACATAKVPDPRYPAREEGCAIATFPDSPPTQSDNLGAVTASCAESVADQDCLRTLKDEACKMGGDVVWGVSAKPVERDGRKYWSGRAAHSKE